MGLVINIRGTGGSGKSTLVRRVMVELFGDERNPWMSPDTRRKRPIGYTCDSTPNSYGFGVVGHYETACGGGCDTIKTVNEVFDIAGMFLKTGREVLMEGIMVGDDVRRTVDLAQAGHRVVVIGLTTPLEVCLASIADRRKARGDERELDPKNTVARAGRLERHYVRLRDGGCEVERLDREAAYRRVLDLLGAA